jgi:type IV pilus assembly protein PilW
MMNFKTRTRRRTSGKRQRGFSLIEMMVAITLGLLLTTGILQLFLNTSRNNDELAKTSALIENGRFALQLLQTGLSHGGFWDGYVPQFDDLTWEDVPTDVPTAVPDPCLTFGSWNAAHVNNLLGIAVQLHHDVPGTCAGIITNRKADTDILVVRHAGTTSCQPDVPGSCQADQLYFQTSFCNDESPYAYRLANDTADLDLLRRDCSTKATARRFVSNIYYIRDYAITEGDGIPTLMRSQFGTNSSGEPAQLPAEALIEGIEDLKIELGIDSHGVSGSAVDYTAAISWPDPNNKVSPSNRGDGAPDSFVRCTGGCTHDQLTNVVAAKIYLLVRAQEGTPGYISDKNYRLGSTDLGSFSDNFKRHVYSTSVRLTNVSGRRETP